MESRKIWRFFGLVIVLLVLLFILYLLQFIQPEADKSDTDAVEDQTEIIVEDSEIFTDNFHFNFKIRNADENSDLYEIEAEYPVVDETYIDSKVSDEVLEIINGFKDDVEEFGPMPIEGRKYRLWFDFDVYQSSQYQTFVYKVSVDTGGAHPNHYFVTQTFDLAGELVTIQDLIQREYHDQAVFFEISDIVKKKLKEDLGELANEEWIDDGAGPESTNFSDFYVTDNSIHFLFEPYAVAAYAASSREVEVKFDEVKVNLVN